ncbi:acylphosphatase [soil metagenome]
MVETKGMRQVRLVVSGKVQGVFYRKFTRQMAMSLNVSGYVQNQKDGSVFVKACGAADQIQKLIDWCSKGPAAAIISKIDIEELPVTNEFFTFEVRRSE